MPEPTKPLILVTEWTDGYGRKYQVVDARLLAEAEDTIAELRDLNTRLMNQAVNGDA